MDNKALKPDADHFTYGDYAKWPENERWELANGAAYAMSPAPGWSHQQLVLEIVILFKDWLKGKPCRAFVSPVDVFIPAPGQKLDDINSVDTVLQPDAGIVCDPSKITPRGIWGAPDLVLEVLSPSTVLRDMNQKRPFYEKAGVREYWLFDSHAEYAIIFQLMENGTFDQGITYKEDDLVPSTIFPGLSVSLQELRQLVNS